jgi:hypothetical protein
MTQDEIIKMAKSINEDWWLDDIDLQDFAKLVAEKEREACAKVCDEFSDVGYVDKKLKADYHAYLIRQRGQT